jgi:hypothetical protein
VREIDKSARRNHISKVVEIHSPEYDLAAFTINNLPPVRIAVIRFSRSSGV